MEAVVAADAEVRLSMYTNKVWQPLDTLFHLLVCSVGPTIKAQIVKTITAFSKSPELVSTIWVKLELCQVQSRATGLSPRSVLSSDFLVRSFKLWLFLHQLQLNLIFDSN